VSRRPATVLLYAEDVRGLGHVNRALTIAQHILSAHSHAVVVIATTSRMPDVFSLPPRCDFIKLPIRLPPRELLGEAHTEIKLRYQSLRRQLLLDVALGLAPDLVLVDHSPLGFGDEFREGLYALKRRYPISHFVYLMQDIVGDPDHICRQWRNRGIYDALESLYDEVVICGSPRIWDGVSRYQLSAEVQAKLAYCGYIVRDLPVKDQSVVRRQYGLTTTGRVVVATVGGGHVGYPVLEASLEALEQLRAEMADLDAVLVGGPLMPAGQLATLAARAAPRDLVLRQADNFELMVAADAIVGMSGYNTAAEAMFVGRPPVLVPQPAEGRHMMEQLLRAEVMADHGLARYIAPDALSGKEIADGLRWALNCDRAAYARRVQQLGLTFDGAAWLSRHLSPTLTRA